MCIYNFEFQVYNLEDIPTLFTSEVLHSDVCVLDTILDRNVQNSREKADLGCYCFLEWTFIKRNATKSGAVILKLLSTLYVA